MREELQELKVPLGQFLQDYRKLILNRLAADGEFRIEWLDHGSEEYEGVSSKQARLAARDLGWPYTTDMDKVGSRLNRVVFGANGRPKAQGE